MSGERGMDDLKMERPTYASLSTPPRPAPPPPARRSSAPWAIAAIVIAFALGLIANPWFEREVRSRLPGALSGSPDAVALATLQARVAALEQLSHGEAADPARLSRVEDRVDTLDSTRDHTDEKLAQINAGLGVVAAKVDATAERADAALTNASEGVERAQALLLVATVRRAVESGARLGALEPALRAAFPSQSDAVNAIAAAAPVTLARLRADFPKLQPAPPPAARSWWGSVRQGLGSLVELRRADAPQAAGPAARPLAAQKLAAGDVPGAIAALGSSANPTWLAQARRYLAAQKGLAQLEASIVAGSAKS